MIRMVGFDLDGTIGETIPMCLRVFARAVSPHAGHLLSEEEIVQTFGLNEVGMVKAIVKEGWEQALEDFYALYEEMHGECSEPYEGVVELIDDLKRCGVQVALITGKGAVSCRITLERFGLQDAFCRIGTGAEDRLNKAELMAGLLEEYGLERDEFLYIGDALSDVAATKEAGVVCLSAAWSEAVDASRLREVNDPALVFGSIEELRNHLAGRIGGLPEAAGEMRP